MRPNLALVLSALLLALPAQSGCASSGSDNVDKTSTRLDDFAASIETLKGNIHDAAAALTQVVELAESDPKPAFEKFSDSTDKVAASTKKARANLDRAQSEGTKLFEAWTKRLESIADEDIRESSQERRDELQKALTKVIDEASPCLTELEAFVTSTQDLQTYLSQDLTPSGIERIEDKAEDVADSAKSLSSDLDDVVEVARKAAPEFATAKPPPEAK